jgi:hypothetical protein
MYNVKPDHFYALTSDAKDSVGTLHGTATNVTFGSSGAVFPGNGFVELPKSQDFSATKTGGMTIATYLTIDDWKAGGNQSEFCHWFGKGEPGQHEYCGRHYIDGGSGEAAQRQGRVSFYGFNAAGGLGAGSYYQDTSEPKTERLFVFTLDRVNVTLWMNGVKRDSDPLSGYNIKQTYTTAPLRLGTRDKTTGYLKGKLRAFGVWNRVLTDAEISGLKLVVPAPVEPTPAPVAKLSKDQLDAVIRKVTELS